MIHLIQQLCARAWRNAWPSWDVGVPQLNDNVCSRSAHNYSVISQTAVPAYDVMSVVSNALAMLGQIPSNDSLRLWPVAVWSRASDSPVTYGALQNVLWMMDWLIDLVQCNDAVRPAMHRCTSALYKFNASASYIMPLLQHCSLPVQLFRMFLLQ